MLKSFKIWRRRLKMVKKIFLLSIFFDFFVWAPFFFIYAQPLLIESHNNDLISFEVFSFLTLFASLIPLIFIAGLIILNEIIENVKPITLLTVEEKIKKGLI